MHQTQQLSRELNMQSRVSSINAKASRAGALFAFNSASEIPRFYRRNLIIPRITEMNTCRAPFELPLPRDN